MLKDLIHTASTLLGLDDVCFYIDALGQEENEIVQVDTPEKPKELDFLIKLANLVVGQIAREYMPIYKEELIESNASCEIGFEKFLHRVNQVTGVAFADGIGTTFRVFPEYIKVGSPNEKFIVSYSLIPDEVYNLENKFMLPVGVGEETVAYGICSEYSLVNMLFDEADMWEAKFKTSLQNCARKLKEKRIPSRGWV